MNPNCKTLVLILGGLTSVALSGCVSLGPKGDPAALYRFGPDDPPSSAKAIGPLRPPVDLHVDLPVASSGDRILSASGARLAYLGGARWVTPAAVIFRNDLTLALASHSRFEPLEGAGHAGRHLSVHVLTFEVDYADGASGAPTVHVVAALSARNDADVDPISMVIDARSAASQNRVGAIVAAYGKAVAEVTDAAVVLVDAQSATSALIAVHPGGS